MIAFALGFLSGICTVLYWVPMLTLSIIIVLWISLILVSLITFKYKLTNQILTIFCIAGILGGSFAAVQCQIRLSNQLELKEGIRTAKMRGVVRNLYVKEGSQVIDVRLSYIDGNQPRGFTRPRVLIYGAKNIRQGQEIEFTAKLKSPHSHYNPGGYDLEKYYFYEYIIGQGYFVSLDNLIKDSEPSVKENLIANINQTIKLTEFMPIIYALTLGSKTDILPAQWEVFAKTGTSHLLAISGLHVATIAAFFYTLLFGLFRRNYPLCHRWPAQYWASCFSFPLTLLYAWLSGFALPTQRAIVMLTVGLLAKLFSKRILSWDVWSIALIAVLVWDPFAPLVKGFWLSFICVAILILSTPAKESSKWVKWLKPQLSIFILLIPISLYFFGGYSLLSPFANMVAIPVVSLVILPMSLLAIPLFAVFPSLAEVILNISSGLFGVLFTYLNFLSHLPHQFLTMTISSVLPVIIATGLLGWSIKLTKVKSWLLTCSAAMIILCFPYEYENSKLKLTFIEVGQGLSVLVQTQKHVLLYDTGPSQGVHAGEKIVLPMLQAMGVKKIDSIMLSHIDDDHAGGITALAPLATEITTSQPALLAQKYRLASKPCEIGQSWEWDGVEFHILAPFKGYSGNRNAGSCVLRIKSRELTALLTGDIDKQVEKQLVKVYGKALKSDLLQVPHHGSKTSSSTDFLEHVSPRYAVFSVGYCNRFGFPHPEVQNRYQQIGSTMFRTTQGAIEFKVDNNSGVSFGVYRDQNPHIWLKKT